MLNPFSPRRAGVVTRVNVSTVARTAKRTVCWMLAFTISPLCAAPALADIVFSNFDDPPTYGTISTAVRNSMHPFGRYDAAMPFTVPPEGDITLASIEVLASSTTVDPGTTLILCTNSAGLPGTEIRSFPLTGVNTTPGVRSVTVTDAPITLAAGVTYWIAMTISANTPMVARDTFWHHVPRAGTFALRSSGNFAWSVTSLLQTPSLRVGGTLIPRQGACCNPTSVACAVTASDVCQTLGGSFRGTNTTCDPQPCILVSANGACCFGGVCEIRTFFTCSGIAGGSQGIFLGPGTVCTPTTRIGPVNACCPADFNGSGEVSVQDLFDFLGVFFLGCP